MALTLTISPKELERQAGLALDGKNYEVFLANNTGGLTADSTAAAWKAVEVAAGNGYAAVTGTTGTGAYVPGNGRVELPDITAAYTASGAGFAYNTVCLHFVGETYLHSISVEAPDITLAAGSSKTYVISLIQDD